MRSRAPAIVAAWMTVAYVTAGPVLGQSAAVEGRIVDEQSLAVPGVAITLRSPATGLERRTSSDGQGAYRMPGLPPGLYDIRAALDGFATVEQRGTVVDLASIVRVDFQLRVAAVAETVAVVAPSPLVQPTSAVVGGVVDQRRIAELPLNGRQFANLAGTLPGVGIGFHRDPTKSTQYMPQVGGGTGRNVAYIVDGADNVDGTVGGPLQQFPLDAIEEFRFSTSSYRAEHGRASGGVMEVVTKSGANHVSASAFDLVRHESLNSRTTTEERTGVPKPAYRRSQFGGSLGGPVVVNKAHFFGALERVQQNTFQVVNTQGLFPALDGVFPVEYRDNLATGKLTLNLGQSDRIAFRYGWNANRQPEGAGPTRSAETWGDSRNRFHSVNATYSRTINASSFNELVVQYATFDNSITTIVQPLEIFPNTVIVGRSPNAPQFTRQRQLQVRDDVAWHRAGRFGVAHDLKLGGSFGYVPFLGVPPVTEPPGSMRFDHLTNDRGGPLTMVTASLTTAPIELPELNTPLKHFGTYVQDDWRVTNRLTLNIGLRYDLALGYQIDQSRNPNFLVLQRAAESGRLRGVIGFEDFGQAPREDANNIQPRVGLALDLHGNGRDVVRGGWGIFTDAAFTNANILIAAADARGLLERGGFSATDPNGLRKPDGTFFRVGDPIAAIASLNQASPIALFNEVLSPLFEQPFTRQVSVGWSHQLDPVTALSADFVHADGRSLSTRLPLNSAPNGRRRFADLGITAPLFRIATSAAWSRYDALLVSLRRRAATRIDLAASYTLSSAKGYLGLAADETAFTGGRTHSVLDATDPFAPAEYGPGATDARHRVSISAIAPIGWGVQVAPIFYYRSALPVNTIEGVDSNNDFNNNELPARAYAFNGIGRPATEIGACPTVNCGRGARFTQLNVRISKRFAMRRGSQFDLIGEIFNLFNASNPAGFNRQRLLANSPNPNFMQPAAFAGDFQQPEQRVGQVGIRWTFGR